MKASEIKREKQAHGISYPVTPRLYPLSDAAKYLGRSVYSLRTLIWNGEIPVIKNGTGGKMWIDVIDMNEWIDKNKTVITV